MQFDKEICICKRIISSPNVSDKQIIFVEKKLKKLLEGKENYKIYVLLGKLYLVKQNINLSRQYFLKALQLNNNAQSIYYGLFRINVIEENYKSAKENLEMFIFLNQSGYLNLDIYKLLLDKILEEDSKYNIDDVYFYEKLYGENLNMYLTGVKLILDEEYEKAILILKNLNNKVRENNLFINFDYVIKLINKLIQIKKQEKFCQENEKLKDYIWKQDIENIDKKVIEVLDMASTDKQIKTILHQIPVLVNNDLYEIALYINETIKNRDINLDYSRMTSFYDRLIKELMYIYNLDDESKSIFQILLRKGLDYCNNGEYKKALDYFLLGISKTNIPLFNYYVGKVYFIIGRYKDSKKALDLYNKVGAYKIYLCKHYLSIINLMYGKKGKALQLSNDAGYFAKLLNKSYVCNLEQSNEDEKLDRLFELIDIKEDDFIKRMK